jgi:hypothetical protein
LLEELGKLGIRPVILRSATLALNFLIRVASSVGVEGESRFMVSGSSTMETTEEEELALAYIH